MTCTRCGREVRATSSFCPYFGEPVAAQTSVLPTAAGGQPAGGPPPGGPPPGPTGPGGSPFARGQEPGGYPAPPAGPPPAAAGPPSLDKQPAPPHVHQGPPPPPYPGQGGPPPYPQQPPPYSQQPPPYPQQQPYQQQQQQRPPQPGRPGGAQGLTDLVSGLSTGLLGGILVGLYPLLNTLAALLAALNDNSLSKTAFVLFGLVIAIVAGGATFVLVTRGKAIRAGRGQLDAVHALSTGVGVLVTTYAVLLVLVALFSSEAAALTVVF